MQNLCYNVSMLEIYYSYAEIKSDDFIRHVLARYYNMPNAALHKSLNGKPYVENAKFQFNLTHSKGLIALGVGKKQLGLDCESLSGKARPAVLNKCSERERAEISTVSDFYAHWTARESYIKYLGETLADCWRRVEYVGGKIWFRGKLTEAVITQFELDNYVFSVCGEYTKINLKKIDV